ncbi:unnamed protein product [Blepharisma stoltei]|uniref:Uncharacterized protein n=1 Tax=Blepharisma stoltei TaxID=1481888 RepID=A0AAU9JBR0_9CILI|nr:unnamed protein product [Blepharisma stoltei]
MVDFQEPFFGVCRDQWPCAIACLIPGGYCWLQSRTTAIVNGGYLLGPFLKVCLGFCIGAAFNRQKIRDAFLIDGHIIKDCVAHLLCPICAVTQEYREVCRRIGPSKTFVLMTS